MNGIDRGKVVFIRGRARRQAVCAQLAVEFEQLGMRLRAARARFVARCNAAGAGVGLPLLAQREKEVEL